MNVGYAEKLPLSLIRHTILVMSFCSIPHIISAPIWLSVLAISAIIYRLLASYKNYPLLPGWLIKIIVVSLLPFLWFYYGQEISSSFFIGALVTFFWLKLIEINTYRDLRAITLMSFYIVFTALIIHNNLWVFLYVICSILTIFSLLLKIDLPFVSIKGLSLSSLKLILFAIPFCMLLFFLFPRIQTPLWVLLSSSSGTVGFQDEVTPGSLAKLTANDNLAFRVTFNKPKLRGVKNYWHGVTLSEYDGITWRKASIPNYYFIHLPLLNKKTKADYEILLEPHEKKWLFYLNNPVIANPKLVFSPNIGLMRSNQKTISQRVSYGLNSKPSAYKYLSPQIRRLNLMLPPKTNPRLKNWALHIKKRYEGNPTKTAMAIIKTIQSQPFWYKLTPSPLKKDKFQLDKFWFETREGYCTHYASAAAFILRAAGIPARVITGYYGGEWNPVGQYLSVRQKNAHAWVEFWQEKLGWVRFDPTAVIPPQRIEKNILEEQNANQSIFEHWESYKNKLPWLSRVKITFESYKFFLERWLLFYNQDRQKSLLAQLGIKSWDLRLLIQLWLGTFLIFIIISGIYLQWRYHHQDSLTREYHLLKKALRTLNITTHPPSTLAQQLEHLTQIKPELKSTVNTFMKDYEQLRLANRIMDSKENRKKTGELINKFRKKAF